MIDGSGTSGKGKIDDDSHDKFMILLFYLYTPIDRVNDQVDFHRDICSTLDLNGRIRISSEGLNVVLSGEKNHLIEYERVLCKDGLNDRVQISQLDSKYCRLRSDLSINDQLFTSLSVKATKNLVTLENCSEIKVEPEPNADFPSRHLSPAEWQQMLLKASEAGDSVLIDVRNVYESKVGYFSVDNVPTILTNTRRYDQLPTILDKVSTKIKGKNVFLYCTGGVRCEKVSKYVNALTKNNNWDGEKPKGVYQLHGGIQRYLENYGHNVDAGSEEDRAKANANCIFLGKNFVFDQRRTDPQVGRGAVGYCILCNEPHSDFDNGRAPSSYSEARCFRCRVLVLVCNACRYKVQCHGESQENDNIRSRLYCGNHGKECINEGNDASQYEIINSNTK